MSPYSFYIPFGQRVVYLPSESPVVYCGIALHAGTRNEAPNEQGLAHFCEHLTFKGTEKYSAVQIINAIEGLGGELNAFTNKEDTVFYCAIHRDHLYKAIDVLTDIVFHSVYPQQEVEKECEVVCDEIESYEDSPAELIYDEFENILFEGHPLGHNILGTTSQVRSYTSEDARRFTSKWYRPENSVLFVSGGMKDEPWTTYAETQNREKLHTRKAPNQSPRPWEGKKGELIVRNRGTHQAHVMMGTQAFDANDDRRWALYLLNNILGGPAMNSRLNLSLRERRGLVYSVESSMVCYSDTGMWSVYFGCDPSDIKSCCQLVRHELNHVMCQPITTTRIIAAKRQLQGQLAIACDNREQYSLDYARTFLHTGHGRTLDDIMAHIKGLTAEDLLSVARQLFAPERITTLIYK
ncbi:MAG: insulinase family protein [Prevotella sp.]|nr:insulinase family protein [Prevotella sp.]